MEDNGAGIEQPGSVAVGTPWKQLQKTIEGERPEMNAGSTKPFRYQPINHRDVFRIQRTALLGQNVGGSPSEELENTGKMEMMTQLAMDTRSVRRLAIRQSGVDGDLPADNVPDSVTSAQGKKDSARTANKMTKEELAEHHTQDTLFDLDPIQMTFLGLGALFLLAGTYSMIRSARD